VNKKLEKAKTTLDKAGHAIDDHVEKKAAKHNFTKPQVWLGLAIGVIAAVAVVKWVL
jgi:hypothetical protein